MSYAIAKPVGPRDQFSCLSEGLKGCLLGPLSLALGFSTEFLYSYSGGFHRKRVNPSKVWPSSLN